MVRRHHRLDGLEFEQALGVGDRQGSLWCCSPWGHKESDTTEQLNNNHSCFTLPLPVFVVLQRESAIRIRMFPLGLPSHLGHLCTEQSSLCYTVGSHQLPVLYIILQICQSQCPSSSYSTFSPWYPQVCSLHPCLSLCFSDKLIDTICQDSTYMH